MGPLCKLSRLSSAWFRGGGFDFIKDKLEALALAKVLRAWGVGWERLASIPGSELESLLSASCVLMACL